MSFIANKNKLIITLSAFLALGAPSFASNSDDSWILNRQGLYKISKGDIEGAIEEFEKACRLDPFNDTAISNLACARNNLGVTYAKNKDFPEAIRQFRNAKAQKPEDISIRLNLLSTLVSTKNRPEAEKEIKELIKLRPNDSDLIIKSATAYQKIENTTEAIAILQSFAERQPSDARVNASLAKLLYLEGSLNESRYYISRSLEIEPTNQKNIDFLAKIDRESGLERNTNNYSGKHFELVCPDSFSEEWAEELLDQLENAYDEVGSKLNFYPEQKAQVLIFQTEDFKNVHDLPDWAGGVYDGKIKLPVPPKTKAQSLKGAILHEYTHHVVYLASSGNCPIWLNEGLAQIFEKNSDELPEVKVENLGYELSLEEIDQGFKNRPNRNTAALLYKLSLSSTCNLIEEHSWAHIPQLLSYYALN